MPKWTCLANEKIFENPWMRLENHTVRGPRGTVFEHVVIHAGPSVRVVAVTEEGRIVITREYRYPSGIWNYELPGGGMQGLRPAAAARKELKEETGYAARKLQAAGKFVVYSGLSSEFCHVFVATGLERREQQLEHTETITVQEVSWRGLRRMIAANRFRDGLSLASLLMASERFPALFSGGLTKTQARRPRKARL